jgi:TPR repeat protein
MAALEGVPGAQYDLAILHLEGRGTPEDPVAAVAWLTEAMKSGDAAIQFKLATLHEDGLGTPVNYANAGVLYTLAANKGHATAAFRIARMAAAGLGTEASIPRAWAYANLAVERGSPEARDLLRDLDAKLDDTERPAAAKELSELRIKAPKPSSSTLPASP